MGELFPDPVFTGILVVFAVIVLRAYAGRARLSAWKLALIGIAAGYIIPHSLAYITRAWRVQPGLPELPVVTGDQLLFGAWMAIFVLAIGLRPNQPPSVPLWAGLLVGLATIIIFPPLVDRLTGSFQRASLRPDLNHCADWVMDQAQPWQVTNICDEQITVGLCLPHEENPAPCAQIHTILPGATARFDPGGAQLSWAPSNLNGSTVVACRPPARPSRMLSVMGRGYDGVCLPPG